MNWSYDEAAIVVDGQFECHVDGAPRALRVGESVYWPRGAVHMFRSIGPGDGRILFICSPERIFVEFIGKVADASIETGTAASGPAVDFRRVAAQFGIEFLG
ncbi:MAG: cupin domain-containing protein [Roseiarcus sp.]